MSSADVMVSLPLSPNFTSAGNYTDYTCETMPEGPLVWGLLSVPCACVGLPANVCLLWVLLQKQRSSLSSDLYLINLTLMNLIINVMSFPGLLNYVLGRDQGLYIMTSIFFFYGTAGQTMFSACICVDCYIAVVHPILYVKLKNSRYRLIACGLVWGLALAYGITVGLSQELYTSSFTVIPYLLTLPPIVFCDLSVLHALRKPDPSGRRDVHPQKQKALQIITNSLIITVVTFLPPLVVFMLLTPMSVSLIVKMCYVVGFTIFAPSLVGVICPLLNMKLLKHSCMTGI